MLSKCILNAICSSDVLYLLTLLTYAIVDANSVDPDQQQSILCLQNLTSRILNISANDKMISAFKIK